MVISKNPDPGTVVIADSVDFGTMVMQGTMVTQGAPAEAATDDDRPAYMKVPCAHWFFPPASLLVES